MSDPLTVAIAIASLAFTKFVETGASKTAEQLSSATLAGLDTLRQQIWNRLRGIPAAESAKATIEAQGTLSPAQLQQLIPALAEVMRTDPAFAQQLSQQANSLSQEPGVSTIMGQNVQAISGGGTGNQINDPTAPVFAGPISNSPININYYQGPPQTPSAPANAPASNAPENAMLRLALMQKLVSVPLPQFEQVLFALDPTPGSVPSAQAAQAVRAKALLDWATSIGPGLDVVEAIYNQVISPR